jgi:hypothetical protein
VFSAVVVETPENAESKLAPSYTMDYSVGRTYK